MEEEVASPELGEVRKPLSPHPGEDWEARRLTVASTPPVSHLFAERGLEG